MNALIYAPQIVPVTISIYTLWRERISCRLLGHPALLRKSINPIMECMFYLSRRT